MKSADRIPINFAHSIFALTPWFVPIPGPTGLSSPLSTLARLVNPSDGNRLCRRRDRFFTQTIDRPDLARRLIRVAHPRNLPVVLSRDEVTRLLNATICLKHQAALSVAYGAGLRVAELAALKVTDVDSESMLLRVERGKGGRYRNAVLPAGLLTLLRKWWKVGHQQGAASAVGQPRQKSR